MISTERFGKKGQFWKHGHFLLKENGRREERKKERKKEKKGKEEKKKEKERQKERKKERRKDRKTVEDVDCVKVLPLF
jgi:hypothetical protein